MLKKILNQVLRFTTWGNTVIHFPYPYYAMFLVAKGLLISEGHMTKTHSGVKSDFSKFYVKEGIFEQKCYVELSRSETFRNQADYDVTFNFNKKVAKERIIAATNFIKVVKDYIRNK